MEFSSFSNLICCNYFAFSIDFNHSLWLINYGDSKNKKDVLINVSSLSFNLTNIKSISCGNNFMVCCDYDGKVYSYGSNKNNTLGIGKTFLQCKELTVPTLIDIPPISYVECGYLFTMCLSYKNELWGFGVGSFGQLGCNHTLNRLFPQNVKNLNNIEYMVCSGHSVICRDSLLNYYSWGHGLFGQLGNNNCSNSSIPLKCSGWPDNIISIKSGLIHTLMLTIDGIVYGLGSNHNGQLGFNKDIDKLTIPTKIPNLPIIKHIQCGNNHSMCLDIDNNLWIFGRNNVGQLGIGHVQNEYIPKQHPTLNNIIGISSLGDITFVKTSQNEIFTFGLSKLKPIQVLKDKEEIWCVKIGRSTQKSARK